ncbi:hypothetical protein F4553_000252 [Allocatelliglobosispora scoriae]|uniref:Uncharacterized protein n=1 Tax=Allocatelliglobosispora scoriae TaxID=643052 RepID=A0A841BII4_9ACTN|nr:hypothetical protein [Allocatelliglobosispora scoriae]MBB5866873.1 hypothetical protein [Allocatelliglobosispora scoriae]
MMFSPVKSMRAGALVAAAVLAAVTVIGLSPAAAAPSPTPAAAGVGYETGLLCPPKTCIGGSGFICAGGSDCGLWVLRNGCGDCRRLALDYDLRAHTAAHDPEVFTGQVVFESGQAVTTLAFRPSAAVTSIDVQLKVDGTVVHRQTVR